MELTPEEINLILEHRKQQDLSKPKFVGYLKEDLYRCDEDIYLAKSAIADKYLTKQQMEETISSLKECFELSIKAGSSFICFINRYGNKEWYDEEGYIEGFSNDWAEEHLERIEKYS